MPFAYILECSDGSFYVGSTRDMAQRLAQHQAGEGAEYTRRRLPVRLAWAGEFTRVVEAFHFEKQVQGWSRAKRIALIEHRYWDLPELSRSGLRLDPEGDFDKLNHRGADCDRGTGPDQR